MDQEAPASGRGRPAVPAAEPLPEPAAPAGPAEVLTAVVHADGSVEDGASPALVGYLRAHPTLLDYVRAFSDCPAPSARFYWWDPGEGWLRVCLAGSAAQWPGPADAQRPGPALVTLAPSALPERLTPRELDVLTLLACGLSNRQIGCRLAASARTISTHVEHVLGKLRQGSRAGAAAVAVDRGYLRLPLPGHGATPTGLTVAYLNARAQPGQPPALPRRAAPAAALVSSRTRCRLRPLVIGSAFPLHGPAGDDGRQMRNGSALAIAEINGRGGIGGRAVQQVVVDIDIFSASGVRQALQRLFTAGVDAITSGYVFAEDVARQQAASYGAPYLHATTSETQAQIVRDNHGQHQGIFQVCPTELHYGAGFIRFLGNVRQTGRWRPRGRRLVFVETPLPSGQMVNEHVTRLAERSGWQIAQVLTVPPLGADWPATLACIERLDPAAIMIAQFLPSELAAFQRLVVQRLPQALIYAIYTPSVPEFCRLAGPAAEGLVWATRTGTYGRAGQRFAADYARAFGRQPGRSHAGIAYDEIHLLANAWAAVPDPSAFRAVAGQLRRVTYRGVNGTYWLGNGRQTGLGFPDDTADPSLGQAHLVFQVQGGKHRIIWPRPYAESSFRPAVPVASPVPGQPR
jgi:branched-chain amino acid transport system substrate-binding protein